MPRVSEFRVSPQEACPGDTVQISWIALDTAIVTITSDPPIDPPIGSVPSQGVVLRTLTHSTTFTISAADSKNPSDVFTQDVVTQVVPYTGTELPFFTNGTCVGQTPEWRIVISPDDFSPNLVVAAVRNQSSFDLLVSHRQPDGTFFDGHAGVPPGGSSAGFIGQPLLGDWLLHLVDPNAPITQVDGNPAFPLNTCTTTNPATGANPPLVRLQIGITTVCASNFKQ